MLRLALHLEPNTRRLFENAGFLLFVCGALERTFGRLVTVTLGGHPLSKAAAHPPAVIAPVPLILAVVVRWQERARQMKVCIELRARRAAEARGN